MTAVIRITQLTKTYASGHPALKSINLEIQRGEIFALLGPNGAGKTTLISIICGIVNPGGGQVEVQGFDVVRDYRQARKAIGLVPQELFNEGFESVWNTVRFSRGLFGKPADDAYLEGLLKELSLWDKRNARMQELSGGMKRRVMIAKALAHEPSVLFLDEPTAGVDVALRRDLWAMVRRLRERGVTIILTTHYIEEAEEMADRIGFIRQGEILRVQDKDELMQQFGQKELHIQLSQPLAELPNTLKAFGVQLDENGVELRYCFDSNAEQDGISRVLRALHEAQIEFTDLQTSQRSLEDIFVSLVESPA